VIGAGGEAAVVDVDAEEEGATGDDEVGFAIAVLVVVVVGTAIGIVFFSSRAVCESGNDDSTTSAEIGRGTATGPPATGFAAIGTMASAVKSRLRRPCTEDVARMTAIEAPPVAAAAGAGANDDTAAGGICILLPTPVGWTRMNCCK
jgi:hypothetical protein